MLYAQIMKKKNKNAAIMAKNIIWDPAIEIFSKSHLQKVVFSTLLVQVLLLSLEVLF